MARYSPIKAYKVELTEDIVLIMDLNKERFNMNRSAFMRYLIRKGMEQVLGLKREDIEQIALEYKASRDNH